MFFLSCILKFLQNIFFLFFPLDNPKFVLPCFNYCHSNEQTTVLSKKPHFSLVELITVAGALSSGEREGERES